MANGNAESVLRPLTGVPDTVKADAFDAFQQASDTADFERRIGSVNIPQSAKAALWDMKNAGATTAPVSLPSSGVTGSFAPPPQQPGSSVIGQVAGQVGSFGQDMLRGASNSFLRSASDVFTTGRMAGQVLTGQTPGLSPQVEQFRRGLAPQGIGEHLGDFLGSALQAIGVTAGVGGVTAGQGLALRAISQGAAQGGLAKAQGASDTGAGIAAVLGSSGELLNAAGAASLAAKVRAAGQMRGETGNAVDALMNERLNGLTTSGVIGQVNARIKILGSALDDTFQKLEDAGARVNLSQGIAAARVRAGSISTGILSRVEQNIEKTLRRSDIPVGPVGQLPTGAAGEQLPVGIASVEPTKAHAFLKGLRDLVEWNPEVRGEQSIDQRTANEAYLEGQRWVRAQLGALSNTASDTFDRLHNLYAARQILAGASRLGKAGRVALGVSRAAPQLAPVAATAAGQVSQPSESAPITP